MHWFKTWWILREAQWIFCNNHDNWRLQSLTGQDELKMCWATQGLRIFPDLGRCYMEGQCKLEKIVMHEQMGFLNSCLMYRPIKTTPACHVEFFRLNLEWQTTGVILSELLLLQECWNDKCRFLWQSRSNSWKWFNWYINIDINCTKGSRGLVVVSCCYQRIRLQEFFDSNVWFHFNVQLALSWQCSFKLVHLIIHFVVTPSSATSRGLVVITFWPGLPGFPLRVMFNCGTLTMNA